MVDDYEKAMVEFNAFVCTLVKRFGKPPYGTFLRRTKSFQHDFGTYNEVVMAFEDIAIMVSMEFSKKGA